MGKMIFKMVLMLGIVVGISNYMLYIMTGKTPFSASDIKIPGFSTPDIKSIANGGKTTAYKWKDENGVIHYSSEPPPEQQQVEVLEVDGNVNLVQGLREQEEVPGPAQSPQGLIDMPSGNVYSPENVQKLIQDAKEVQQKLNERYAEQEKILSGGYEE